MGWSVFARSSGRVQFPTSGPDQTCAPHLEPHGHANNSFSRYLMARGAPLCSLSSSAACPLPPSTKVIPRRSPSSLPHEAFASTLHQHYRHVAVFVLNRIVNELSQNSRSTVRHPFGRNPCKVHVTTGRQGRQTVLAYRINRRCLSSSQRCAR